MTAHSYSARRRLVAATLVCMLVIFGGIGLAARAVARHESSELFSARLATSARVLEALLARQLETATVTRPLVIALPRELESAASDEPEAFGHRYETKVAFQVWHEDGRLLARSVSAPDQALAPLQAGFSQQDSGTVLWQVFALRSGRIWVLAAEKDEVRSELADHIGKSILLPLIVGGLLMLAVVNILLLRSMRPLTALARIIAARKPDSLDPVQLPATPVELAPIIVELNHLLDRIRAAFTREQRFIDAAAHEIRTPIAAVQLHIENALRSTTAGERDQALDAALSGARRTSKLAEQLLALGRISARSDHYQPQRLALAALCCDVIATMEPLLSRRGQGISLNVRDECDAWGEPSQLRRMLRNLIDNASVHGAPHGEIDVVLARRGERAVLRVANDGVAIPEDEVGKLFVPYYRPAGSAAGGHGLGLAIVKEIVDQHDGAIALFRKDDGQGTVVEVTLPLCAPGADDGTGQAML